MKSIAKLAACIAALAFAGPSLAQDTYATLEEAKAAMTKVVADYVERDQLEALRKLPKFSTSRTDEEQRVQIQKYVKWNTDTSEKRGAPVSYRFISTKTVGDAVARLRFLVLTERLPITFDFFLYKKASSVPWSLADLGLSSGAVSLFVTQEQ